MIPSSTDSRGRQSKTLTFVAIAFAAVVLRFLGAGLELGPLGEVPAMGGGEFAAAIAAVLGIWLGREYQARGKEGVGRWNMDGQPRNKGDDHA